MRSANLRLPPPGHHILTVLGPDRLTTVAVKIFTTTQSAVNDVELPTTPRLPAPVSGS